MIDRLCFGTSTFAAGLLCPDKDSGPGIETLREAAHRGLRRVHSNPGLRTQWAVRRALADAPAVRHHVKADVPFDAPHESSILDAIRTSREALGVNIVDALVVEIDLKRTIDVRYLCDQGQITEFFSRCASIALSSGQVGEVYAYSHTPREMQAAMAARHITGLAAPFNLAVPWPAVFFDRLDTPFLGMSPLARGALTGVAGAPRPLIAVRWAIAEPRVTPVITMSSMAHLDEVVRAVADPLPVSEVRLLVDRWLDLAGTRR